MEDMLKQLSEHKEAFEPFVWAHCKAIVVRSVAMSVLAVVSWLSLIALTWHVVIEQAISSQMIFALAMFLLFGTIFTSQIGGK